MSVSSFQKHISKSDRVLWCEADPLYARGQIILADGVVAMLVPKAQLQLDLRLLHETDMNRYLHDFYKAATRTTFIRSEMGHADGRDRELSLFTSEGSRYAWVQSRFFKYFPATSVGFLGEGLSPLYVTYKDELLGWIMPVRRERGNVDG